LKKKRTAPGKSDHLVDGDPGAVIDRFPRSRVAQDNMEVRRLSQHDVRALSSGLEPTLRWGGSQRSATEDFLADLETANDAARVQKGRDLGVRPRLPAVEGALDLAEAAEHILGHVLVADILGH